MRIVLLERDEALNGTLGTVLCRAADAPGSGRAAMSGDRWQVACDEDGRRRNFRPANLRRVEGAGSDESATVVLDVETGATGAHDLDHYRMEMEMESTELAVTGNGNGSGTDALRRAAI